MDQLIDLREPPNSSDFDDIEHELCSSWREACGSYSAFPAITTEAAAAFLAGQRPSGRSSSPWRP